MDTIVAGEAAATAARSETSSRSLIEVAFPAQRVSVEAQKERKAGGGQTLTVLGSYWKGRKPLILARACILASLLPATEEIEKDLEILEVLLGMDDGAVAARMKRPLTLKEVLRLGTPAEVDELIDWVERPGGKAPVWRKMDRGTRMTIMGGIIARLPYRDRLEFCLRPEEIAETKLLGSRWHEVNLHLGTSSTGMAELVDQLGRSRFWRRPRVADPFSGGGSIPFEAARIGCDVYAADLNPIACMLTWGALNVLGVDESRARSIEHARRRVAEAVERETLELGVETDSQGHRAKAFLYCLETKCPRSGWMVPLAPNWIISNTRKVVARLVPDHANKMFDIEVVSNASAEEMSAASVGTMQSGRLIYELDGDVYDTPIKQIRGDRREGRDSSRNALRLWERGDFAPRPGDIFQERLYAIQWAHVDTLDKGRQQIFFTGAREEDIEREKSVEHIVRSKLEYWQGAGLVADMPIEHGKETTRLTRERGWTYWHHLFSPRNLLGLALWGKYAREFDDEIRAALAIDLAIILDNACKLCRWNAGHPGSGEYTTNVFYNQALNPHYTYSSRSVAHICSTLLVARSAQRVSGEAMLECVSAVNVDTQNDVYVTDPPYADAVNYHEITEFFIAWLRKDPPGPFRDWVWDSKRSLAIKGDGDEFKRSMIRAYSAMAARMPDNGLQVIMFTHQSGSVWADMASIMWASGLRVTAAWYISTETTSELKKGGYVQGTVLLVVRKRLEDARAYEDELAAEIRDEAQAQIETLTGLNQRVKARSELDENLFEDADLQMAGYAAALRVLTGYRFIGGKDMAQEALRPRVKGEVTDVDRFIELAVGIATEYLIPDGIPAATWGRLGPEERFYLKMLGLEAEGLKKLDNYQNFAKAYRVPDFQPLMASMAPNAARLKTATEMRRGLSEGRFGQSMTRAVLYAIQALAADADGGEVLHGLKDAVPGYLERKRDGDLEAVVRYLERRTAGTRPEESRAAKILAELLYNDHL